MIVELPATICINESTTLNSNDNSQAKKMPTIEILQTGGELNGIYTAPFSEAPLYEKGKIYVFY